MKSGIEELSIELMGLKEERRLVEGMLVEVEAKLAERLTPADRRFYTESMVAFRSDIASLDKAIAVRERVRKSLQAMAV